MTSRIQMIAEYDLDVPSGSYLRAVCVDGETMFLLATHDSPSEGLQCRVTAFDLARGATLGTMDIPYIKHDNGGGSLSASAGGCRVAVGSEFSINIYDLDDGEFSPIAHLETEQGVCAAKFLGPDRTIHWNIDAFESTDLLSGESYRGPEEDDRGALEDFVLEPDGRHLIAVGNVKANQPGYRTVLHRVRIADFEIVNSYEVAGYVVKNFVVAEHGHAYFVADSYLLELNLATGQSTFLQGQIRGATFNPFSSCMRLTDEGMLHVVTHDALITTPTTGMSRFSSLFPRPVEGAGFDAHGRLWTFDEASKVTGWEVR